MSETLKKSAASKEDAFLLVCSILLDQIVDLQKNMHIYTRTLLKV